MIPSQLDADSVLPEDVPIPIPELPATLIVDTAQQFKAVGDPTRMRILDIIKHEPATAKQIGGRLKIAPSTIGHHLQVLEEAGLAQIVARRLVHGIVAKYYMRTARLFVFEFPRSSTEEASKALNDLAELRNQLADSLTSGGEAFAACRTAFPHTRLSRERVEDFYKRLFDLIYEFATASSDPEGQVYGFYSAFFLAPSYLQKSSNEASADAPGEADTEEDQ